MNTAVAKTEGSAVAVPDDLWDDILSDAGDDKGFSRDDLTIPYLVILQDLSPQVKKTKDKFIEGASASMICNTVTEDLYDGEEGVLFVPVHFTRRHTEFEPRSSGGGFVADYGDDDSILQKCIRHEETGRLRTPEGNDLVVSMDYYGFVFDHVSQTFKQCVVALAGTQFKKGRPWNTTITSLRIPHPKHPEQTINPAMFYQAYRLTTQPESNDQGDWYGWKIKSECPTMSLPGGVQAYREARAFKELVESGRARAGSPDEATASETPAKSEPREDYKPSAELDDDEIPF